VIGFPQGAAVPQHPPLSLLVTRRAARA